MCPMIKPTIKPKIKPKISSLSNCKPLVHFGATLSLPAKRQSEVADQALNLLRATASTGCRKKKGDGKTPAAQPWKAIDEDLGLASNPVLSESKELTKTWQVLASQSRNLRGIRV